MTEKQVEEAPKHLCMKCGESKIRENFFSTSEGDRDYECIICRMEKIREQCEEKFLDNFDKEEVTKYCAELIEGLGLQMPYIVWRGDAFDPDGDEIESDNDNDNDNSKEEED